MVFTSMSSKVNYIIATVADGLNASATLPEAYREDVKNEISTAEDMEDNTILQDTLLGNKVLHGGENSFEVFFLTK